MNNIGLISGARGQDSSELSRLLIDKGWKVIAFERNTQSPDYTNIKDIMGHPNYVLEKGDVTDLGSIARLLREYEPKHFYHLAAASFVGTSWNEAISVFNTNAIGTLNCLEAIRNYSPKCKFLLASTSEVVGNSKETIQNEDTILTPHSPYAASKAAAEHLIKVYRGSHKLFCCYTRCYNHEGIYRGKQFVTRKITDWIGRNWNIVDRNIGELLPNNSLISTEKCFQMALERGLIKKLTIGNRESSRDWLSAKDCVRGMHMVLNQETPDDFVLASGKMHSIKDLLRIAFDAIGIKDYEYFIESDPKYMRPDDVVTLCGDYSKAKRVLGWEPTITFEELIKEMVKHDMKINSNV